MINVIERLSQQVPQSNYNFNDIMNSAVDLSKSFANYSFYMNALKTDENLDLVITTASSEYPPIIFKTTDWAISQLASKLEVPMRYIRKCVNNNLHKVAQANLNIWLTRQPSPAQLVLYGDMCCGILSNNFTVIHDFQALEILQSSLNMQDYDITEFQLTTERMYMRFVGRVPIVIPNHPEITIFPMFTLENSTVGWSSLKLSVKFTGLKRQFGISLPSLKSSAEQASILIGKRHVGCDIDILHRMFCDAVRSIDGLYEIMGTLIANAIENPLDERKINRVVTYLIKNYRVSDTFILALRNSITQNNTATLFDLLGTYGNVVNSFDFSTEYRDQLEQASSYILAFK